MTPACCKKENPKDEKTATDIEVSKDCFTLPFTDSAQ